MKLQAHWLVLGDPFLFLKSMSMQYPQKDVCTRTHVVVKYSSEKMKREGEKILSVLPTPKCKCPSPSPLSFYQYLKGNTDNGIVAQGAALSTIDQIGVPK